MSYALVAAPDGLVATSAAAGTARASLGGLVVCQTGEAMSRRYITTAIPYVNSKPHLGFAMELVQTDVMARHWRHRGHEVRFLSGTDDNSLKNALAAAAEGVPTQELVDRNAAAFYDLRGPLQIGFDDFIRTSGDLRHTRGVERLWGATTASGDLYQKHYECLYCVGCEQFYTEAELVDGLCPEHLTTPQLVSEENWFFKLSATRASFANSSRPVH